MQESPHQPVEGPMCALAAGPVGSAVDDELETQHRSSLPEMFGGRVGVGEARRLGRRDEPDGRAVARELDHTRADAGTEVEDREGLACDQVAERLGGDGGEAPLEARDRRAGRAGDE